MLLIISFPIWILFGIIFPMIAYGLEHYIESTCVDSGPHVIYIDCKFYLPDDLYYGGQFSLWMTMKLHNIQPLVNTIQMLYVFPDESFVQLDLHELPNQNPNNPLFILHMTDSKKVNDIILNPNSWKHVTPGAASTNNEHKLVLGIDKNQVDLNNNKLSRNQKVEIAMTLTLQNYGNPFVTDCYVILGEFLCETNKDLIDMLHISHRLRLTVTLEKLPTISEYIDIRGNSGPHSPIVRLIKCDSCALTNPFKLHFVGYIPDTKAVLKFLSNALPQRTRVLVFYFAIEQLFPRGYQGSSNGKIKLEIVSY